MAEDRLIEAIARFDAVNAEDPNSQTIDGVQRPRELVYAERMSAWLERLAADASDVVRLAVRAQHIRRWTIARESYPMDRAGYRKWRTDLGKFHAETAGGILPRRNPSSLSRCCARTWFPLPSRGGHPPLLCSEYRGCGGTAM